MSRNQEKKSIVFVSGLAFASPMTVSQVEMSIAQEKPIKVYQSNSDRTGYRDILLTEMIVNGDYSVANQETAEVVEDGEQLHIQEQEEFKKKQEELAALATEQETEEPITPNQE